MKNADFPYVDVHQLNASSFFRVPTNCTPCRDDGVPQDPLDSRPQNECCICLEPYGGEPPKVIRKTPCGR